MAYVPHPILLYSPSVVIEDKHNFTKKDPKEVITYWNYTVSPMDEYNPKRK